MTKKLRISKRTVDRLKGDGRDRFYWDERVPGFGVRVRESGRKSYVVQFRVSGGRIRRVTLGQHGALSPKDARRRAVELLSSARLGLDADAPREKDRTEDARAKKPMGPKVRDLAKRFLEEYATAHCKPRTRVEYRRLVEGHVLPNLGDEAVADLRRIEVIALHQSMRATPYQANRILSVLSKMFNLAEIWGMRREGSNPCTRVLRFPEGRRERFLSSEEIAQLGRTLDESLAAGKEKRPAIAALRLLMLTGCRLSEVLTLRWEFVDLQAREIRLPDSKTGRRSVPLSPSAARLLEDLRREAAGPWVFVGRRGDRLKDLHAPWGRIRRRAGLESVRIHDLRHSFASRALALGESLTMIGKLLGHSQLKTTARYAHLADQAVRASAARVGDSIAEDLGTGP